MAARSAVLLVALAFAAQLASATYIGYIDTCAGVNSLKCTGALGSMTLTGVSSCNKVTVGCYGGFNAGSQTCSSSLDSGSCPSCVDNGNSITLKCTGKAFPFQSCGAGNPSEWPTLGMLFYVASTRGVDSEHHWHLCKG